MPRERLRSRNEGLGITVNLPYGRTPTPIQSGGPGGEFGGTQRLYTGRNPFMTPNDPGMDFGAPRRRQGSSFGQFNYERGQSGYRPNSNLSFEDQVYPGKPHIFNFDRAGPSSRRLGPPSDIGYDRMGGIMGLNGGQASDTYAALMGGMNRNRLLGQQTSYNVGDTYPLEGKGGYGTRGPFTIAPHDIQELETIPLDMQFDQWGNPIGGDDYGYFDDTFAARGGLMSLRR